MLKIQELPGAMPLDPTVALLLDPAVRFQPPLRVCPPPPPQMPPLDSALYTVLKFYYGIGLYNRRKGIKNSC